ncbi:NUDIX hydrolase [Flexibacterium corallicola]|uniref:NUDIX hydrolase n=1 Tax=Flexibacterium corallicola TaxID=3037259 RepID=UPI00286F133A|nr:NUDIX domain-containing protein [Pseudovibrio sp. M1P-2-3]
MKSIPVNVFISSVFSIRNRETRPEVLLLKRTQGLAGEWCQVAGKIKEGETAWQAALRELGEETGLKPLSLYRADVCEQFYEPARDAITMTCVFVAFVNANDTVSLNHEHSAYRWSSFEDAIELVPFGGQRRVLRAIEEDFVQRKPSKHLLIKEL